MFIQKEILLSTVLMAAGLLPFSANAYMPFEGKTVPNSLLLNANSLHLSPLKKANEVKQATVCFVTDTKECTGNEFDNSDDFGNNNDHGFPPSGGNPDYTLDNSERCKNEGYTLSGCPDGFKPSGKCPYGDYYAKCVELCPSDYKTCELPYVGVGTPCDGKYASCECTPCEAGYDYTDIPEGYVQDGEACLDCNGVTKYKIKVNPCNGYLDCGSAGPESGANSCQSGSQIKYDNCKPCPNLGTLTSCPSTYTCTYEECSNRYYKSGCESGYTWDAATQTCIKQCSSSYKYTCTEANEIGGSGTACDEKYTACRCADGYSWIEGNCVFCQDILAEGWTYDSSTCPYGTSISEWGTYQECYREKFKCSICKLPEYQIGSIYKDGVVVDVQTINAETCEYELIVLTNITKTKCNCALDVILYPLKFYQQVFANIDRINKAMQSLSKPGISTEFPYRSVDTSYPRPESSGFLGQEIYGTFNMSTGKEENSVVCLSEFRCDQYLAFGDGDEELDYKYSNNLILKKYSCRGDVCTQKPIKVFKSSNGLSLDFEWG